MNKNIVPITAGDPPPVAAPSRFATPQRWLIGGGVLLVIIALILWFLRNDPPGITLVVQNAPPGTEIIIDEVKRGLIAADGKFIVPYLSASGNHKLKFSPNGTSAPIDETQWNKGADDNTREVDLSAALAAIKPLKIGTPTTTPVGMAYVAGGEFTMGRNDGDEYERPTKKVTVAPFYIDKTEVTNAAYQKFLDERPDYPAPPHWVERRFPAGQDKHPVSNVTWDDAQAYTAYVNKRLPTEAEWEFAARGGGARRYSWGDEWSKELANAGNQQTGPVEVGSYPKGATPETGLLDMIGNVWEWTSSDLSHYDGSAIDKKYRGHNFKIIRGGSFKIAAEFATTTMRGFDPPNRQVRLANYGFSFAVTGFRCAKTAENAK